MLAYEHSSFFAHLWNNRLLSPDFFLSISVSVPFFLLTVVQGPKRVKCVSFRRTNFDAFLTFTVISTSVLFNMKQCFVPVSSKQRWRWQQHYLTKHYTLLFGGTLRPIDRGLVLNDPKVEINLFQLPTKSCI